MKVESKRHNLLQGNAFIMWSVNNSCYRLPNLRNWALCCIQTIEADNAYIHQLTIPSLVQVMPQIEFSNVLFCEATLSNAMIYFICQFVLYIVVFCSFRTFSKWIVSFVSMQYNWNESSQFDLVQIRPCCHLPRRSYIARHIKALLMLYQLEHIQYHWTHWFSDG